nr:immunoglobulin light chain junction region [Macaca mulatta]
DYYCQMWDSSNDHYFF